MLNWLTNKDKIEKLEKKVRELEELSIIEKYHFGNDSNNNKVYLKLLNKNELQISSDSYEYVTLTSNYIIIELRDFLLKHFPLESKDESKD
jgi:hypothetical protein